MARIETITMTMREIDRLKTVQAVVDGNLKPLQAAQRLNVTTRQIQRLANRYRRLDFSTFVRLSAISVGG